MKWSLKLGTFAGIGVYVHATFVLLLGFFAWSFWVEGRSALAVVNGISFILAVFTCVVLHEFGHMLGLPHVHCDSNDKACYGVTDEEQDNIMGHGSAVSARDYEVFAEAANQFSYCRWKPVETRSAVLRGIVGGLIGGVLGAGIGAIFGPIGALVGGLIGIAAGAIIGAATA